MNAADMHTEGAWYALRRTLPPHAFEANLAELVECTPRYGIDEVIVIVDPEELSHGLTPLHWIEQYLPMLQRIKEVLASIGVAYSLNPWVTHGHTDRARNASDALPGVRHIVGHDGAVSRGCACSLDPIWRQWIEKAWALYARTEPRVMWVEDDVRLFNHGAVRYGCFCDLHVEQFSQEVGRAVDRERLVAAILQPGQPHPWRQVWLDLQGRNMVGAAALLRKAVDAVSPSTLLGLMSSGPRAHCLEGRQWQKFCTALGGDRPILSRPPLGNYDEQSLRGLYFAPDSIKLTRHVTPVRTIEQTEVENIPFTGYANSQAFTFLKMAVSAAYGSAGMTLNLFDHLGTPMEDDAAVGQMLADRKPFLNALARAAAAPGRLRGVQLLHHPRSSYHKQLSPGDGYRQLEADGYAMMQWLETLGIATTYDPSNVVAVCGQTLRGFDDEQIRSLLSGALLLDGAAAGVVLERGLGDLIGLRDWQGLYPFDDPAIGSISAEAVLRRGFGGGIGLYMTAQLPGISHDVSGAGRIANVTPTDDSILISQLVDPDLRPIRPCMVAMENELGGRVVVTAWELATAMGVAMLNPRRASTMQAAVSWLGRGDVDIMATGGAYPLVLRRDLSARPVTLLGLFNLSLDPWPNVAWKLTENRCIAQLAYLTPGGQWVTDDRLTMTRDGTELTVSAAAAVSYNQPLFARLTWS